MSSSVIPNYVVGIDAGGTKSQMVIWRRECLHLESTGDALLSQAISNQRLLGINLDALDAIRAHERFLTMIDAAAQSIELSLPDFLQQSLFVMGMAGLDSELDQKNAETWLSQIWDELGVTPRISLIPDIELALWSAASDGAGIVIIAGTGSNCYGRNRQGKSAKASGMSHFFSDEGSGFMLGWEALHALAKMNDGRMGVTPLMAALLAEYEVATVAELKRSVVKHPDYKLEVARAAPVVQRLSSQGDPVASAIVRVQNQELVRMVAAVQSSLNTWEGRVFPVGGLFADEPYLALFRQGVEHLGLEVAQERISHPVTGAIAYARAQLS